MSRVLATLLLALQLAGAESKQSLSKLPSIPGVASKSKEDTADELDQQNIPYCVINSLAALFYATQSGIEVAGAADDCPSQKLTGHAERLTCTADIFGVLQSFLNVGSLISGLVTQCDPTIDAPADCASNVLGFAGNFFEAFEAGFSSQGTCAGQHDIDTRFLLAKDAHERKRWLEAPASFKNTSGTPRELQTVGRYASRVTPLQGAWCFVDIGSGLTYLAQFGITIDIVAETGACENQTTPEQIAECSGAVNAMIAGFANGVSYLATISTHCAATATAGDCVSDVAAMVNAFTGIASAASQFLLTCKDAIAEGNKWFGQQMEKKNPRKQFQFNYFTPP
mmetsp:Transcript_96926/g.172530  ORF Transcript_96926/g.172530 Transcript_96926/m.172530 type:complete len:339 (-) Transcript_96926:272-1288(-)